MNTTTTYKSTSNITIHNGFFREYEFYLESAMRAFGYEWRCHVIEDIDCLNGPEPDYAAYHITFRSLDEKFSAEHKCIALLNDLEATCSVFEDSVKHLIASALTAEGNRNNIGAFSMPNNTVEIPVSQPQIIKLFDEESQ